MGMGGKGRGCPAREAAAGHEVSNILPGWPPEARFLPNATKPPTHVTLSKAKGLGLADLSRVRTKHRNQPRRHRPAGRFACQPPAHRSIASAPKSKRESGLRLALSARSVAGLTRSSSPMAPSIARTRGGSPGPTRIRLEPAHAPRLAAPLAWPSRSSRSHAVSHSQDAELRAVTEEPPVLILLHETCEM